MENQVDREAMQMAEQKMPKTIQIRSTAEMSAWLTDYCKQHGMTAGEVLAEMRQAVSEHDTILSAPEMEKQISDYRAYRSVLDTMYLNAIQGQHDAEVKARTSVQEQLNALGRSLAEEQNKAEKAQDEAKSAMSAKESAELAREEADKRLKEVMSQADHDIQQAYDARKKAEETAAAKTQLADTLSEDLLEYKKKAAAYDELNEKYLKAEDARKAAEQEVKDVKRDAAEAAKEAARAAEKAQDQAVRAQMEEDRKVIEDLREQLNSSRRDVEIYREKLQTAQEQIKKGEETFQAQLDAVKAQMEADKERALAQTQLDISQKYIDQIEGLHNKLDSRTEEILKLKNAK